MAELSENVRKFVFDYFFEHAHAPVLEEIMRKFGLSRDEAHGVLRELEAGKHLVTVRGTQRILLADPFATIATPFRVTVSGERRYFAMCAWDAIAFHVTLGKDVIVDSFCHHCAEENHVTLSGQKAVAVSPEDVLVYIGVPAAKWWDVIIYTCSNAMVFFNSPKHMDEWKEKNPEQTGQALTIDQVLRLSVPIYRDKVRLGYVRPTRDELMTHFESIGLRGDFWKI